MTAIVVTASVTIVPHTQLQSLGSTPHNEAHRSIVLPISNEEKSPIYDINILTDSSSSDSDDLPGIKLAAYTSKHKHKTNKSF